MRQVSIWTMSYSGSFGNVARDDASVHTANQGYIQGVPPPVAEVPQARARFSLTPALAGHEILDYTTAAGAKTFEAEIKPLSDCHSRRRSWVQVPVKCAS